MENSHPEIPQGPYCYRAGPIDEKTGKHARNVCPHWHPKLINGWPGAHCSLLNKDGEYQSSDFIWDHVKECGINDEWES